MEIKDQSPVRNPDSRNYLNIKENCLSLSAAAFGVLAAIEGIALHQMRHELATNQSALEKAIDSFGELQQSSIHTVAIMEQHFLNEKAMPPAQLIPLAEALRWDSGANEMFGTNRITLSELYSDSPNFTALHLPPIPGLENLSTQPSCCRGPVVHDKFINGSVNLHSDSSVKDYLTSQYPGNRALQR